MEVSEVGSNAVTPIRTYNRWRGKYGGPMPSEMKCLKQLQEEHPAEAPGGESEPGRGDAAEPALGLGPRTSSSEKYDTRSGPGAGRLFAPRTVLLSAGTLGLRSNSGRQITRDNGPSRV